MKKLIAIFFLCAPVFGQTPATRRPTPATQPPASLTYNQLIGAGYDLLKEVRLGEAYLAATEAAQRNPSRFEAYALAALTLHVRGADREAKPFIDKALSLAPPIKKRLLNQLADEIAGGLAPKSKIETSDPEERRKLDVLRLILEDADKATGAKNRRGFLIEFLDKTGQFVTQYPGEIEMWVLRGAAATELDAPQEGRQAGLQLMKAGLDKSDNEKIRRLIATMDRKGWIYPMDLQVEPLVAEFNRVLSAMGTSYGGRTAYINSYEKNGDEGEYRAKRISFGELHGNCTTGYDLETKETGEFHINSSVPENRDKDTWTLSGIYHFDVANVNFYSAAGERKFYNREIAIFSGYSSIRDRKRHAVTIEAGKTSSDDSEPNDNQFTLAADYSDAEQLSELLNKIHWACLCQQ